MGREGELAILGLQAVNVNRAIGRLSRDEFIERIPSHALDVVRVLCDLADHLACGSISFHNETTLPIENRPFCAL